MHMKPCLLYTSMEGAKDIDTQLRFTLVPNEDNWLISKIEQKSE